MAPWWFSGVISACFAGHNGACVAGMITWMPLALCPLIGGILAWGFYWDREKLMREEFREPRA